MRIEPDSLIADQVLFDPRSNTISFLGGQIASLSSEKLINIKITLLNASGENSYIQLVMVYPFSEQIGEKKIEKIEKSEIFKEDLIKPETNIS